MNQKLLKILEDYILDHYNSKIHHNHHMVKKRLSKKDKKR